MSIVIIVVMCVFVVSALAVLNHGPMDKRSNGSKAYWAQFEAK